MKQRIAIMMTLLCLGLTANAQKGKSIGIGVTVPDPSAILHIESENQGVLIPNIALVDLNQRTPIDAEAKESLLVYNTVETNEIAKGYYYWTMTSENPAGKWVRVLTSEDYALILEGQIQESFVEETIMENGVELGTGVFVYTPDKKQASEPDAPGRLVLDIPSLVEKNQTVTEFNLEQFTLYYYSNGDITRDPKTQAEMIDEGVRLDKKTTELELVYKDEEKNTFNFAVKDLLGANNDSVPAITNLKLNAGGTGLIYTNEKGHNIELSLVDLVKRNETVTSMTIDQDYNLVFINERNAKQQVNLRNVVNEPWKRPEDNSEAINTTDNMFSGGWVGVGLTPAQANTAINNLKPDEMLRVNGSIYARNSYYADYVFDNYYTNEISELKEDYNFKDLNTVESFIKENYHLPGITPIGELEQTTSEGYLINVSELSIQLLEKVEELYLHTIEQHKIIERQKAQLERLEAQFSVLESKINGKK